MHKNENKFVRASEAASFYMCPRLVYFQRRYPNDISDAMVRASFFKALSASLPSVLLSSRPEIALEEAIVNACSDSLLIYGPFYEPAVSNAGLVARGKVRNIIAGLQEEKKLMGEVRLTETLSPGCIGLALYSDKLRLSGTIDRVEWGGKIPCPTIISASDPPVAGVYASDRIRLAAYALLIMEKYGVACTSGAVEYVPGWSLRRAEIRYEDKRKALYARNRVLEMDMGRMPEAIKGKWCAHCGHYDACNVKVSLLGRLFK
jgi:CRISPR-associated exonuclease Cas4